MKKILSVFFVSTFLFVFATNINAQNSFKFSCTADTTVDCSRTCVDLKGLIPDVHALSSDYTVNPVISSDGSVGCFPSSEPLLSTGPSTNLIDDDEYSPIVPLPFSFPFYGISWSDIVISTNGEICFDVTMANQFSNWVINGNLPSVNYDRAVIMGPFHDINIEENTSPLRQVKYNVIGQAPHRKLVLTFYKIPCYNCTNLINNSYQITLYESLGIVEVFIAERQVCNTWNPTTGPGKAIVGIQNYARNKAVMAPGRTATSPAWGALNMNETWRFTPKNGPSLFKKVELIDLAGNVVATGDTSRGVNNNLAVTFRGVCPAATTKYVVKSTYYHYEYFQAPAFWGPPPGLLPEDSLVYGIDTVVIYKNGSIPAVTFRKRDAQCGTNPNGSIIITAPPAGTGYDYSIDGGNTYQASDSFSVPAGTYTVTVRDISGSCKKDTTVTIITALSTLKGSATSTNTSCPGVNDGTITASGSLGTAPYEYAVDGGATPVFASPNSNYFTGLSAGIHTVFVKDAAGCIYSFPDTIKSDPIFTTTASSVNATCLGALNGSITVTPPSGGTPSFEYAIPGGVYNTPQPGASFTGLLGDSTYTITVKDSRGCIDTFTQAVGYDPGFTATAVPHSSSCAGVNNGFIELPVPTNGTAPYFYHVDTVNAPPGFLNIDTVRNLSSGLYDVTIKDNAGCLFNLTGISVTSGTGVSARAITEKTACSVASTGKIDLSIDLFTGTAPFYYSLNNGIFQLFAFGRVDTIKNLAAGNYSVVIRDGAGCTYNIPPITITAGVGVNARDSVVVAECSVASTGKIFIKPSSGIAPFQFSKDSGVTWQLTIDSFINLLPGIYHVAVKDAVGCSYYFNSTVGVGAGITATDSTIQSNCITAATGKIFVKPAAGFSPYQFSKDSGVTWQANIDSFVNLLPATYHIAVKDAVGCSYYFNSTVGVGAGITATDSTIQSNCITAATGKIFVKPAAGFSPYQFSKDSGVTWQANIDSFINLLPGTYRIAVKDAVGCSYYFNSTVGIGAGVTATDSTIKSNCATATTGKIFIKPGLGIAPFQFSKDSGLTFQANIDSFINLLPGTYHIAVKDAVGCSYYFNSTVGIGVGVTATDSTIETNCTIVKTGKIYLKPGLGVPPFQYSNDSGSTYKLANSFINLSAGVYQIAVKDAVGCVARFTSTVAAGVGVTASDSVIKSECAAATTGKIFVKPGLGIAPFEFSNDSGITYHFADSFVNLAPQVYHIAVKDAVGCINHFNSTVGAGTGVSATARSVNSACLGVSTGQIIVTPSAGTAPYTYTINSSGSLPLGNDTISNLLSGSYNVVLTDAVGCSYNVPAVPVNNDIGITATFTPVKSACAAAATGAIIVKPLTGNGGFRYSIDGGSTFQADSVFRNLSAALYTIDITDAIGCKLTSPAQNVTNNPGVLTNPSTIQNASCETIPNGSITVNVTAGIAPFSYKITSPITGAPQTGNQFTSLSSGSYDITITDSAGCTAPITSVVGSNPKVKIDSLNIVRPTCNTLQDGTIAVNVSLGVAPYSYAIDRLPYDISKSFSSIGAGSHFIQIKDANNCSIDTTIIVTEPALFTTAVVSTAKATCSGNPDGKITMTAAGGTTPYQYTLDASTLTGYQPAATFDVLKGSYTVTAMDAMGCKASANATVDSVFTMYLDLGNETTVCSGAGVVLTPTTNPETNIFSYSPKGSLDKDNIQNPTASPTDTTTYTLTAQWGICTLTDNIKVNVLRKPVANAGSDVVICFDTTTVLRASASNLSGTVNFAWSPASLLDTKADTTVVTARPIEEDTYFTVTVTDNYNCNFSVTDSVLVKMLPKVYAFAGNDTNAVLNVPHQLTATGAGIGGTYVWSYPAGVTLSDNQVAKPMATFIPVPEPGTYVNPDTNFYRLSVIATDAAGCSATDTIKINVFIGPTCYVPSAFSPNGDGLNDRFVPVPVGVNIQYFRVFNRYGEVVYETSRFRNGWDGMHKGKPQPVGAYVWLFKGKDQRGRDVINKGTVMLVR